MNLATISTPALIIDEGRVRANIERWQALANQYDVALRPHKKPTKVSKSPACKLPQGHTGLPRPN